MRLALFLFAVFLPFISTAQRSYPPKMADAEVQTYKTADGDVGLRVWIFKPDDWKASDSRPAAVFFFGGGWKSGSPQQFEQQCKQLAERGMVAMTADYRVSSRHQTKAKSCVEDARDAVRWIRGNATKLGVNPDKVMAGGGSAGGHVAACLGTIIVDEQGLSSMPNAMALFNPAAVLARYEGLSFWEKDRSAEMRERMGVDPVELSPIHHVHKDAAPAIIFHGTKDTTVPYATAAAYAKAMKEAGVKCELASFEGAGHGFFNYGRDGNKHFDATMKKLNDFLVSLGWLEATE
ncbi:MAG: alpha/beta hydrolase [Verrucomicrobiota bacterium]